MVRIKFRRADNRGWAEFEVPNWVYRAELKDWTVEGAIRDLACALCRDAKRSQKQAGHKGSACHFCRLALACPSRQITEVCIKVIPHWREAVDAATRIWRASRLGCPPDRADVLELRKMRRWIRRCAARGARV